MMKKFLRTTALSLAAISLLSLTAFAAPVVNAKNGFEVSATVSADEKKLDTVTIYDDVIVEDGQYMIFVVDGDLPTADSILYINQKQAEKDEKVTFNNVYPKEMKNSNIMLSGTGMSGATVVAEIVLEDEPEFVKGDVDRSGTFDVGDATKLLTYLAGLIKEDDLNLAAADVDNSNAVDVGDATFMLKVLANLATMK